METLACPHQAKGRTLQHADLRRLYPLPRSQESCLPGEPSSAVQWFLCRDSGERLTKSWERAKNGTELHGGQTQVYGCNIF